MIFNIGGPMEDEVPRVKYTGIGEFVNEGNGKWYFVAKGSGKLTLDLNCDVDIFCVGGGGGGGNADNIQGSAPYGAGGGAGGARKTRFNYCMDSSKQYDIRTGFGGGLGGNGGPSYIKDGSTTILQAAGGLPGYAPSDEGPGSGGVNPDGANGGGGAASTNGRDGGNGGYAFNDPNFGQRKLYGGGGGGGGRSNSSGFQKYGGFGGNGGGGVGGLPSHEYKYNDDNSINKTYGEAIRYTSGIAQNGKNAVEYTGAGGGGAAGNGRHDKTGGNGSFGVVIIRSAR